MRKIRILIADDHAIIREGLRQLLNAQPDMEVIGEAEDGCRPWSLQTHHPDVIVLDIGMPGLSGLDVISLIRETVHPPDGRPVHAAKESYVHQALASEPWLCPEGRRRARTSSRRSGRPTGEIISSAPRSGRTSSAATSEPGKNPRPQGYELLTEREHRFPSRRGGKLDRPHCRRPVRQRQDGGKAPHQRHDKLGITTGLSS
jgi:CheY-like chemotaxis protein